MEWAGLLYGTIGLALGGILKGATGAGAPIIAIPVLAMLYDVPLAIAIFSIPNLLANLWQGWRYRSEQLPRKFMVAFAGAGMAGAVVGSVLLVSLPPDFLLIAIAGLVLIYIAFRIMRPTWKLAITAAQRLAAPLGFVAGVLQTAVGLSAPVSITLLNAMQLPRMTFMATISVFFAAVGVVQIPMLVGFGILTIERAALSFLALMPVVALMPVGAFLAKHISKQSFDRIILSLLFVIACRLLWRALG